MVYNFINILINYYFNKYKKYIIIFLNNLNLLNCKYFMLLAIIISVCQNCNIGASVLL